MKIGSPQPAPASGFRARSRWACAALLLAVMVLGSACTEQVSKRLGEAIALQNEGSYKKSVDTLRAVLKEDPSNVEASYRLGLALAQIGRPSEALFPLRKASASSDPIGIQAGLLAASLLLQTSNFEETIAAAEAVLRHDPENSVALLLRARAALEINRGETALDSADRLVALEPEKAQWKLLRAKALGKLGKKQEADALFASLTEADWGDDATGPQRACLARVRFLFKEADDDANAQAALHGCEERFQDDAATMVGAADLLDEADHREESIALLQRVLKRNPDFPTVRDALASRLIQADRLAEAETLVEDRAEYAQDAPSWMAVAQIRRQLGNPEGALEAIESATKSLGKADDEINLMRAEVLIELHRVDEAGKLLTELDAPLYREILEGRLAYERGDPTAALKYYDQALQQWPNNWGLRVLTAIAALDTGKVERAKRELIEASRHGEAKTDAALWLAKLYLADGQWADALSFAHRDIHYRGTSSPAAYVIAARAAYGEGRFELASKELRALAKARNGEFLADAIAEDARLHAKKNGTEQGLKFLRNVIAKHSIDLSKPSSAPVLLEFVQLQIDMGHAAEATTRVHGLLAKHPDSASLHALAGRMDLIAGKLPRAAAEFAKALDQDADNAGAWAGRALLLRTQGDVDGAIQAMDRATKSAPLVSDYLYQASRMRSDRGETAAAQQGYEATLRIDPDHVGAANDLAWLLVQNGGDLDRAEMLARRALRAGIQPEILDTLGSVQLKKGKSTAALETFKRALAQNPAYATARYHMALAMVETGDQDGARKALRKVLAEEPFPESNEAKATLARLVGSEGTR